MRPAFEQRGFFIVPRGTLQIISFCIVQAKAFFYVCCNGSGNLQRLPKGSAGKR